MVYLWHLFPLGLWKEDGWLFFLQAPVSFRFSLWTLKIQNNQIHFSRMVLKYNVCFFHNMLWKNPNKLNFLAKSMYQTITSWQIDGETMETVTDFIFFGSKITSVGDCSLEIKRCLLLGRKAMTNLDSILKSRHYFANKDPSSQSYGFSSSHVRMWELDHKEGWTPKNWCFLTVVLEKILESFLDCEIKPVNPKRNQPWILTERTDSEAEVLTLYPPDCDEQTHWKRPWCWERLKAKGEGTTEDEMVI